MEQAAGTPFQIRPARFQSELDAVRGLFAAYAASLPVDLHYQDFDSEIADLPGKYAPPGGELLVAWSVTDKPIGCVGLRALGDIGACEMKRLFVVPEARSSGLGRALAEAAVEAARMRGYGLLRLDTLSTMVSAARLYQQMGFRPIEAYYGPTPAGTIFMELDLTAKPPG